VSEKAEVVQAYAEAYRGLARLYNDYQGIATSNATQDAVEQEYRSQKDRIANEVHKISTDLEVKVNKLNDISLRLNITRSRTGNYWNTLIAFLSCVTTSLLDESRGIAFHYRRNRTGV
jgi:hypothetical protein